MFTMGPALRAGASGPAPTLPALLNFDDLGSYPPGGVAPGTLYAATTGVTITNGLIRLTDDLVNAVDCDPRPSSVGSLLAPTIHGSPLNFSVDTAFIYTSISITICHAAASLSFIFTDIYGEEKTYDINPTGGSWIWTSFVPDLYGLGPISSISINTSPSGASFFLDEIALS